MSSHAVLGQVALGYSPMIDRHRAVTAVRVTVFPARQDATPKAGDLLAAMAETWPADAGRVSLNIVGETLLQDLLNTELPLNMMVEVPAFMAADIAHTEALQTLHNRGNTLLIKGRPLTPLPREALPCFAYSIIDLSDERRDGTPAPGGVSRNIPHVQGEVRTLAQMNDSFARGAIAVLGSPIDDAIVHTGKSAAQPDLQAIVELINRVDRQEPVERLEAVMKNDPTMAFKLMRYINSPAFGLSVEITSFRHAIMLLGYARMKRWLALLLTTASKDHSMRPIMFGAVRRGLLMEELAQGMSEREQRDEMFICGLFSLLDHMLKAPFDKLLQSIPVPERVRQALVDDGGPFHPYLELVRAIESESVFDYRERADALMLGAGEINACVLRALHKATQLE